MLYRTTAPGHRFIGRITANQLRFHLARSNLMTHEKVKPTVYITFHPVDVIRARSHRHRVRDNSETEQPTDSSNSSSKTAEVSSPTNCQGNTYIYLHLFRAKVEGSLDSSSVAQLTWIHASSLDLGMRNHRLRSALLQKRLPMKPPDYDGSLTRLAAFVLRRFALKTNANVPEKGKRGERTDSAWSTEKKKNELAACYYNSLES